MTESNSQATQKSDALFKLAFGASFSAQTVYFYPPLKLIQQLKLFQINGVISDKLNHANIFNGILLCKAKRYRNNSSDIIDLEA